MPVGIGAKASIIVDLTCARSRRSPIEGIAALGAAHEPLHDTGSHGAPRRVNLVSLESFLGECEGLLADDWRHRNRDPILSRSFVTGAVTSGHATAHPDRPRDALARRYRRLTETRLTFVRRIAQHAPHRRTLPAATSLASRDRLFVHQASDGANAEALNAVEFEYLTYDPSLLFVDLIIRGRVVCLADKSISKWSSAR